MTRQIILDTETTGLEYAKGHRIVEIGCLEMVNRRLTGRSFQRYINPQRDMDPEAFQISGISNEFLKDKPLFSEIVDEFLQFIKDSEVIIHNAPFDLGFINNELNLLQHPWGSVDAYIQVVDTLLLARTLHPGQKNNLDALCKRYGIDNKHRIYHGALLDAEILSKVYLQMTAGQSSLTLEEEQREFLGNRRKVNRRSKIRTADVILKVVKANEKECELHEAMMKSLRKEIVT